MQVYLTTLERVKDGVRQACETRGMGPAETAAVASSLGGGVASLATQAVVVPIDVVKTPPPPKFLRVLTDVPAEVLYMCSTCGLRGRRAVVPDALLSA